MCKHRWRRMLAPPVPQPNAPLPFRRKLRPVWSIPSATRTSKRTRRECVGKFSYMFWEFNQTVQFNRAIQLGAPNQCPLCGVLVLSYLAPQTGVVVDSQHRRFGDLRASGQSAHASAALRHTEFVLPQGIGEGSTDTLERQRG